MLPRRGWLLEQQKVRGEEGGREKTIGDCGPGCEAEDAVGY